MQRTADQATVNAVAALGDPVRRSLFDAVRSAPSPLTREDAATAVGISRKLAAFHLDKLVGVGLLSLDTSCEESGRRPGRVGRRPKRYRPDESGVQLSIPLRRPLLLAELLLEGVTSSGRAEDPADAVLRVARERGQAAGEQQPTSGSRRMGVERALTLLRSLLERLGYEPVQASAGALQFRSCPFHPLSATAPDLVCRIHHTYVSGVIEGLGVNSVQASLSPGSGGCCVELHGRRG